MTRSLWRNPAFWAVAVLLVALGLVLAFAVFGIQTLLKSTKTSVPLLQPLQSKDLLKPTRQLPAIRS